MLAKIGESGLVITSDPDNADVVVINTCGFIAPAKAEAIEAIKAAVKRKKRGTVKKVVVAGCLSQRMGKSLFDEVKGIDAIVGLGGRDDIAEVIKETINSDIAQLYLPEHTDVGDDRGRFLITPASLGISSNQRRLQSQMLFLHNTGHSRQIPFKAV